jgi:hypothetical protein
MNFLLMFMATAPVVPNRAKKTVEHDFACIGGDRDNGLSPTSFANQTVLGTRLSSFPHRL